MNDPQLIVQLESQGQPFASVVIDSLINTTSSGGVRIYSNVSLEEVKMLAREMTLKFSFIGLPRGGAKCGIRVPDEATRSEKLALCEEFGRRIGPIVNTGLYYPGMDMNCGQDELRAIYRGAGTTLGKITDTSFFTALSVANALFAVRTHLHLERPLTIAIEGFGSVGAHLAQRLPEEQFRIVALSTLQGAVRNNSGFSHQQLFAFRRQHGDHLVFYLPDQVRVDLQEVLAADVDILIPAARILSINEKNMDSIRARCIVPVANAPYTRETVGALHAKGVQCLPGFVTNSGGVFASGLFDSGLAVADVERIATEHYRPVVAALLQKAVRMGRSAADLAEEIALQRFERNCVLAGQNRLSDRVLRKFQKMGVVPLSFTSGRTAEKFVRNLKLLLTEIEK